MVSLRQFETDQSGTFGNAAHPDALPGKAALKLARMARAVDLLVEHPAPTIVTLAQELGISRATVYRILGDDGFQALLKKALAGRIALVARKAMDQIERALDEGTPALRLKAATWLLERQQKLQQMTSPADRQFSAEEKFAAFTAKIEELKVRRQGQGGAGAPTDVGGFSLAEAARLSLQQKADADEDLADAELLDDDRDLKTT